MSVFSDCKKPMERAVSQTTHISEADMDNAHNEHAEDQVENTELSAQQEPREI